jgi:dTDP-4-amino-4,6-dideoxygalactose transaminase
MEKLALVGGIPVRRKPYPPNVTTSHEEIEVVTAVMTKGILSDFEGANTKYFMGGTEVKRLEKEWTEKFNVKYAISVNSATSGLYAAIGAAGIGPGDEVIVTPWTMSATAAAILVYNAIPVFCDITPDTFNLDPSKLESLINKRTKAIMVVHLFGNPADMDEIMRIAEKHNLVVIEDVAQAPTALYHNKYAGTIGDMGIFSLNSNKIIQTGEGGIITTDDDELANRLQLIRNHAEAAIATGKQVKSLVNMLGWNYRMNEIEAAIARVQLSKLDDLLAKRRALVSHLERQLKTIPGIITPVVKEGTTHTYYRYALKLDPEKIKIPAPLFVKALQAEGMDFYPSYDPLYLQPLYQQKIVFGDRGCPFTCQHYTGKVRYSRGICPNAEALGSQVFSTEVVRPPMTFADMDEIYQAFEKIVANVDQLKTIEQ